MQKEECCFSSLTKKKLCQANTWFQKKQNRKVTFKAGEFATEIDFVLIGKKRRKYLKDIKTIPWELQHRLDVSDVEKKKLKEVVKMKGVVRRRLWKFKEDIIRERYERRVLELVDVNAQNLWKSFKDGFLKACDKLCGKKLVRQDGGNTWWWSEKVKDAVAKKKKAFKDLCKDGCKANKPLYKKIRNRTKKVVASAMRKEAEKETKDLREKPNHAFNLVK